MGETTQTIELNGKLYNALTGEMLSDTQKQSSIVSAPTPRTHPPRRVASTEQNTKIQKSKTLNRSYVKKPVVINKELSHKSKNSSVSIGKQNSLLQRTYSVPQPRLQRAVETPQNQNIKRFPIKPTKMEPISSNRISNQSATNVVRTQSKVLNTTNTNPIEDAVRNASVDTGRVSSRKGFSIAKALNISKRALNLGVVSLIAIGVLGFLGYKEAPTIAMHVASMRADVDAGLPAYSPAGFRLNRNIDYKPGQIVLTYQSNSDDRNFNVIQEASVWDSSALKDNFVNFQEQVRMITDKGKTIYLYGDDSATWVDGGVWYRIEGTSKLNGEQLSRLASSF